MADSEGHPMKPEDREKLLSEVKQKGVLDETERKNLIEKLDSDFDLFLKEKIGSNRKDEHHVPATDEDIDKLAEELRNHPAFMTDVDLSKPLTKETEALIAMQYDDNAESYKNDGNYNFKLKKYRWAVDNYTEGIKCKSKDKTINAILYSNRAAAQFHLGNFGSALKDASIARKFKPDHLKAFVKGAQCCTELKRYDDSVRWCDDGLLLDPREPKLLEIRSRAQKLVRQAEKSRRKEEAKERKQMAENRQLLQVIQDRGVTLAEFSTEDQRNLDPLLLTNLESCHPSNAKVFLNDKGQLEWPVMFLYPEHGESDIITAFNEQANFEDHLVHMFGSQVPWDNDGKYTPEKLEIYFENKDVQKLFRVKPTSTLASVLKNKKYVVHGGTPGFIILVKDSPFAKTFLERYEFCCLGD